MSVAHLCTEMSRHVKRSIGIMQPRIEDTWSLEDYEDV